MERSQYSLIYKYFQIKSLTNSRIMFCNYREILPVILQICVIQLGYAIVQLVEALCYKPEGRGFEFQ
jgi:hypothetical protein